ncbi:MerR family transcriptional regulator [Streptomyces uncialis]|uniref:MerR family transcriptional regulator n=1 Tax=Streptomyces uncialis TaxID=1048205 RepID=UPI00364E1C48
MRIGDVAAATGLTTRAVRYYEEQGLLSPGRTPSGHRTYTSADIRRLRTVSELLQAGLTVTDVRSFAHVLDTAPLRDPSRAGEPDRCDVAEVAQHRLGELDQRIARLSSIRDGLASQLTNRFGDLFAPPPPPPPPPGPAPASAPASRPGNCPAPDGT